MQVFALLGCCAALVGSNLPTFRDSVSVLYLRVRRSKRMNYLTLGNGMDLLSRNVGTKIQTRVAQHPSASKTSTTPLRKHEISHQTEVVLKKLFRFLNFKH
jgi:hypothetical protein